MSTSGWTRSGSWDTMPAPADGTPGTRTRQPRGGVDFVLFALLPMAKFQVEGLPIGELAMGVAVVLALSRRATVKPAVGMVVVLLTALFGLLVLSAQLHDITPYRRLLHVGLYLALALMASQGRFHIGGLSRGLGAGLVVSAGASFTGVSSNYEGRLTGLMADPNAAGYMLTTLGCLALAGMTGSRLRVPLGVILLVAVMLTYSRTSLLAALLILVWVLVGSRVATLFGSLFLGGMIYAVTNIPVSLRHWGPFADRVGSDALRRRIVALEQVQIDQAPWYGNGPGTSKVDVQGEPFFFHNSYLSLLNEGGRLAVGVLVGAGAVALVGLMRLPAALRNHWYEGAVIAVAVCSVNLGEVLLELPASLALGLAVWYARDGRARARAEAGA